MLAQGIQVAAVTRDKPQANASWSKRLRLPYPILTDSAGEAGRAFAVIRHVGIGAWKVEFFRRSTFLVDVHGTISAVWRSVKVRGHAQEVMAMARALGRVEG